jgi:hypothetical protein
LQAKYSCVKKYLFYVSAFLIFGFSLNAQQGELLIKKGTGGAYLEHKTAPKEGLFPLGRKYNVHPRHLAAFNQLDFNKGLSIGQLIKIPLTDTNFNQQTAKGIPVYYKTTGNESLANISIKNNKVSLSNLRSWNHLTDDHIPADTKLIIGYLITSDMQDQEPLTEEKKNEEKKPEITTGEEKKNPAREKETEAINKAETPQLADKETKLAFLPEKEKKPVDTTVVKTEKAADKPEIKTGFFKIYFDEQLKQSPVSKELLLTASVFQTASGWQDSKYYALLDGVEPGTIIKITNPENNQSIYAKVLYGMEGIRLNDGLDIRISDAAAAALAIKETDKFVLKIAY